MEVLPFAKRCFGLLEFTQIFPIYGIVFISRKFD